ncbi:MFS transporter [Streptococcus pseudoporcinus]|uniref:Major facilitator superfamily protein n=1 Tax=Streptococcus pseudoporcinus TaxID=361101 RepID=A0A4U9XIR6_9STRE|nr:MFS transporter [Streptococcus pseudoporcinus]VTS12672.1 major facilitator superfamily protein [Streptococcus pseudoporcinus]VUC65345.1 major facilitator superfamily protein [Streptococcus pseudoporcinus]VUC96201.1 major facilitator superfamily protein [Streptococcus pseudoporcinus]VUC96597.1 major facilitator superfamily protein [Streptococcus pseudoporcinus]
MFKNNNYNFTAFLLWMTYFCHGIQAIIISQNALFFATKWQVEAATVFAVIAWTGLGKITFLTFAGALSDKIGRKPLIVLGLCGYVMMFGSLLVATQLWVANILAFIGGAINPALFEMYPQNKATASIFSKAFISISSMLYPLFVAYLVSHQLAIEIGIIVPFILSILVLIGVLLARFPDGDIRNEENVSASEAIKILEAQQGIEHLVTSAKVTPNKQSASFAIDGLILSAFAFTIYSTFYLFQQASKLYAQHVIHLSETGAATVTSYYQLGSLMATVVFAFLMGRGIRDIALLVISPIFAGLAGLLVYLIPTAATLSLAGILIGFFAAGGLLQMGNAVLNQFFDKNKGRNTSLYYFVMALGSFIVPTLASRLIAVNRADLIMLFVSICGFASAALMVLAGNRYHHIFGVSIFSKSIKMESQ